MRRPKAGSYALRHKGSLVKLPDDQLRDAEAELSDYVLRLYEGGGYYNWSTRSHFGVYRGRLRAVQEELVSRGFDIEISDYWQPAEKVSTEPPREHRVPWDWSTGSVPVTEDALREVADRAEGAERS